MDDVPEKQCTGPCGRMLPDTFEFFHRHRGKTYPKCKECRSVETKDYNSRPEVKARKKVTQQAHRSHPEVQERLKAYNKAYEQREHRRHRHRERKAYNRAYYHSHPGVQANQKAFHSLPDKVEQKRDYRKLPKVQKQQQEYRRRPQVRERQTAYQHRYRSLKRSVLGITTPTQIREMLQRHHYHCYYCGNKLQKSSKRAYGYEVHIEHTFPLSRVTGTNIPANDSSYLVPACNSCNLRKGTKFPWEFPEGGRLL